MCETEAAGLRCGAALRDTRVVEYSAIMGADMILTPPFRTL